MFISLECGASVGSESEFPSKIFFVPTHAALAPVRHNPGTCFVSTCPPSCEIRSRDLIRHLRFAAWRSRAIRSAVRFFAAASDAFFARAERSSAVMVSRLRLPPILPPFRPSWRITSEISFLLST